jgi:MraZ protein
VFTGEYRHTVDDKGRIAVPAKFRAQLGAGAVVSRWLDACLAIHTQAGWDALAAKVAALPITDRWVSTRPWWTGSGSICRGPG